jgi:hypothetical protein
LKGMGGKPQGKGMVSTSILVAALHGIAITRKVGPEMDGGAPGIKLQQRKGPQPGGRLVAHECTPKRGWAVCVWGPRFPRVASKAASLVECAWAWVVCDGAWCGARGQWDNAKQCRTVHKRGPDKTGQVGEGRLVGEREWSWLGWGARSTGAGQQGVQGSNTRLGSGGQCNMEKSEEKGEEQSAEKSVVWGMGCRGEKRPRSFSTSLSTLDTAGGHEA